MVNEPVLMYEYSGITKFSGLISVDLAVFLGWVGIIFASAADHFVRLRKNVYIIIFASV